MQGKTEGWKEAGKWTCDPDEHTRKAESSWDWSDADEHNVETRDLDFVCKYVCVPRDGEK